MTLEEYYKLALEFFNSANKLDYINSVIALKNSITGLKNYRGNPVGNAQAINNTKNQISNQKNQVITKLVTIREELMGNNLYDSFYDSYLGMDVYDTLNQINQNIDINNIPFLDKVDSILNQVTTLFNFYTAAINAINANGIVSTEPERKESLVLTFEEEAFIDDLVGLAVASKDWNLVIIGFARLVGTNDTKGEVLSITRGSLIMSLLSDHKILVTIGSCAVAVMELIKQKLKIKEQQLEIEKLNLPNKKDIIKLLEDNATINVKEQSKKISNDLIEEFFDEKNVNGKPETKTFLKKAVIIVINYLTKGLKLEIRLIESNEQENKILNELKGLNKEIKDTQELLAAYSEKRILLVENTELDESKLVDETDIEDTESNITNNDSSVVEPDQIKGQSDKPIDNI